MFLRDAKGQAMLVAMAIVLAMFLMCSAVLVMGRNARLIAVFEVNQDKAYYTAEAGIEKVLAEAKNGPAWLRNLNIGAEYDFLANVLGGENNYSEGVFEYIKVKKLAEDGSHTSLEIECRGKCGTSIKRIRANADLETVYAENLFRGLRVAGGCPGGNVYNLESESYFSGVDVVIAGGSVMSGDIYSRGTVCLQGEGGAIEIDGDIYAMGGLSRTGSGPVSISGVIYVDDINAVPDEFKDRTVVLPAVELAAKIPGYSEFPGLLSAGRLAWYEKNANYIQLPPLDHATMVFHNGIYFLSGDQALSGIYSGNALIVINGSVALGSLTRSGQSDNLAVLATGAVVFDAAGGDTEALVYSGGQAHFSGGAVRGGVLAAGLAESDSPVRFSYDEDMVNVFLDNCSWTTCFVRITSWSE